MNILENHLKSGEFSHAYLLTGDFSCSRSLAVKASGVILSPKGKIEAHPDFFYYKFDLFGIKDSHILRARASRGPMLGDSKVFVIELASVSLESANALLKMFEEPYPETYFFVITTFKEDIIPTLASRLTLVDSSKQQIKIGKEDLDTCRNFLTSLPNKRMESVKKLFTERHEAVEFINKLEVFIFGAQDVDGEVKYKILEEIQRSREFLYSKGSSPRMVLEHLSLVLPSI